MIDAFLASYWPYFALIVGFLVVGIAAFRDSPDTDSSEEEK